MSAPAEEPPGVELLRVEKGHAAPEELAALTVVLCARIAAAGIASGGAGTEGARGRGIRGHPADRDRRRHQARTPCWSGCWTCG